MASEYKNYIDGKWVKSKSGETFESLNPVTEKSIGKFQKPGREDFKQDGIKGKKNN